MKTNFEKCFLEKLGSSHAVKSLDKCDFSLIQQYLVDQREQKKNRPSEEKKAEKEKKQQQDEILGYALVDGVREKVASYQVEPPGLFRGRGEHPLAGFLKSRLIPEDVGINVGKDQMIPKCPIPGHAWKDVVHNNTDPILKTSHAKYIWLSASSKFKGLSDRNKYDKARKLQDKIETIRNDYEKKINSSDDHNSQLGTALYLIDRLALRVGNEKGEDEADTVGCCSLRVEHIKFLEEGQIELDFLGKDSMRYHNTVKIDAQVWNNMQQFAKDKNPTDELFNKISTAQLNDYLKSLMEGLTAKVFRTYNASITLQQQLDKMPTNIQSDLDKVVFYNDANREVAILCNHQKAVPKTHEQAVEKLHEKLKLKLDQLAVLEDNDKVLQGKKSKLPQSQREKVKKLPANKESNQKAISRMKSSIKAEEVKIQMKEDNKQVALGTSKINYMDPRITIAWCKKWDVPIEKIFSKSLRQKFPWAMYASPDWRF